MNDRQIAKRTQINSISLPFCLKGAIPRKCLPNQGGHQHENDYIYYDRESGDKAATKVMEARDDLTELSGESIIEKNIKGANSYNFELCLIFNESYANLYLLSHVTLYFRSNGSD